MNHLKGILIKLKPLRGALWLVIFMLAAWWIFVGKDYRFMRVTGQSMEPTLNDGQWMVVEKPKKNQTFDRFDMVLLKDEKEYGTMCKRIIGVAGDEILFGNGLIFINGQKLNDKIARELKTYKMFTVEAELIVPEGHVWVIGDNRENSWHGLISIKNILGKIIL
jgi:signal peptidase I